MGTEEFYLLIMPIIYWTVNASLGFRLGAILLLAGGVNIILKWALHLPRPYWYDARIQGMGKLETLESRGELFIGHARYGHFNRHVHR